MRRSSLGTTANHRFHPDIPHLTRLSLKTSLPVGPRNKTKTYSTHANMSAAMRQKLQELVKPIGSQEEWDEFIQNTAGKKLLIIDIHKKWCGPCEVMRPTFERIFLNTDDCDQKAEFLAVHSDAGISQLSSFTEKATSKPFFVLWKENGRSKGRRGQCTGAKCAYIRKHPQLVR